MTITVKANWMAACGFGNVDTTFNVLFSRSFGPGRTFATVNRNGRMWEVWVEERCVID